MARGRDVTCRNRLTERERGMSGCELSGAVWAFRRGRRKMRVPILERGALARVHHAVVAAASAAARGQTRLRTGRNERQHRPEPVQEKETNAHSAPHSARIPRSPFETESGLGLPALLSKFRGLGLAQRQSIISALSPPTHSLRNQGFREYYPPMRKSRLETCRARSLANTRCTNQHKKSPRVAFLHEFEGSSRPRFESGHDSFSRALQSPSRASFPNRLSSTAYFFSSGGGGSAPGKMPSSGARSFSVRSGSGSGLRGIIWSRCAAL